MCDILIMSDETHDGRTDKEIQGEEFLKLVSTITIWSPQKVSDDDKD